METPIFHVPCVVLLNTADRCVRSICLAFGWGRGSGGNSTDGAGGTNNGGEGGQTNTGGTGTGGFVEVDLPDCDEDANSTFENGDNEGEECWDHSECKGVASAQFLNRCSGTCLEFFDNEERIARSMLQAGLARGFPGRVELTGPGATGAEIIESR